MGLSFKKKLFIVSIVSVVMVFLSFIAGALYANNNRLAHDIGHTQREQSRHLQQVYDKNNLIDTTNFNVSIDCVNSVGRVLAGGGSDNKSAPLQIGSAIAIAQDKDSNTTTFVTCLHILTINDKISKTVKIEIQNKEYNARVKAVDADKDLVLLTIDALIDSVCNGWELFQSASDIKFGNECTAIGYKDGKKKVITKGNIAGLDYDKGNNSMTILTTNKTAMGFSGGGLFNASGRLIGIIQSKSHWGLDDYTAYCIDIASIKALMS